MAILKKPINKGKRLEGRDCNDGGLGWEEKPVGPLVWERGILNQIRPGN